MKGLLHSKLFRKNLFKWLFMYVTVIGLFTSVVTYSKYISSLQSNSKTKVAKFDASITYDGVCAGLEEGTCNNGTFRPTSNISYYFTVTTDFEVSTLFVTRISVLDVFTNIKIYDITEGEIEITDSFNPPIKSNILINNSYSKEIYKVYTFAEDINLGENHIRKYKVTMDFDSKAASDTDYLIKHDKNGALIVGYSATQID